jgi:phage tail-like protein
MADAAREVTLPPFATFNFLIAFDVEGLPKPLCSASFSECDGLEMSVEVKKIREGGNNVTQIHLNGPVSYGQLTLKRGMTSTLDLWDWFELLQKTDSYGLRGSAVVTLLAADGATEQMRYKLTGCMPVKIKAPALNAKETQVAIEEMQVVYERLSIERPQE